jgi:hypothetical protein
MMMKPQSSAIYHGDLHRDLSTDIAFVIRCPGTHDDLQFITSSRHRQFFRVKVMDLIARKPVFISFLASRYIRPSGYINLTTDYSN